MYREVPCILHSSSPDCSILCKTIIHIPDQEMKLGTMHRSCWSFKLHLRVPAYRILCKCVPCVALCNHHRNQGTEQFHRCMATICSSSELQPRLYSLSLEDFHINEITCSVSLRCAFFTQHNSLVPFKTLYLLVVLSFLLLSRIPSLTIHPLKEGC